MSSTAESTLECICDGHGVILLGPQPQCPVHPPALSVWLEKMAYSEHTLRQVLIPDLCVLVTPYVGISKRVTTRCSFGHTETTIAASIVTRGYGCARCERRRQMEEKLAKHGWRLIDEDYNYAADRFNALCAAGHPTTVLYNDWKHSQYCDECRREKGQARLEAVVAEQNCTLLTRFEIVTDPVDGICSADHHWSLAPCRAFAGERLCTECHYAMDRVYLICHPNLPYVKIGISSQDRRVVLHESRGWIRITEIVDMDDGAARKAERAVLNVLSSYGFEPLNKELMPIKPDGWTETFHADGFEIALDVLRSSDVTIDDTVESNFLKWFKGVDSGRNTSPLLLCG